MKSGMCVSRSRNADIKYGVVTWIISERLRKAYVPCPLTQRTGLGWAAWADHISRAKWYDDCSDVLLDGTFQQPDGQTFEE